MLARHRVATLLRASPRLMSLCRGTNAVAVAVTEANGSVQNARWYHACSALHSNKSPRDPHEPSLSYDDMLIKSAKDDFDDLPNAETIATDSEEQGREGDSETTRSRLLDSALLYVQRDGWSLKAISSAAADLGLSPAIEDMFPRGGGDLVLHFIEDSNRRLASHLQMVQDKMPDVQQGKKDLRCYLKDAIEVRLRMVIPHMSTWQSAMALMVLPQNASEAVENLANMVDEIWYQAGDTSTDMDWYSKRLALAAIYGATEVYMTTDRSTDYVNTWQFLDNRLQDIQRLDEAKSFMEQTYGKAYEGLSVTLSTIRNMAGMRGR